MSATGANHPIHGQPEQPVIGLVDQGSAGRRYVRRRDRLGDSENRLSRQQLRSLIPVSQTYWAVEQEDNTSEAERNRRWLQLRKYGDFSMAYSTHVQPRLTYFEKDDIDGFIAFRQRWGLSFALGDPVVAPENKPKLIQAFCNQNKGITFCQVSESTAELLHKLGFYINEMGVDTALDLETYDFAGKEKEWLRYADNWTKRRGYEVREYKYGEIAESDVEQVSEAWRKTRTVKHKEVRFLNRPIVVANPEPDVRKFYFFDSDNNLLAFVFLDPLYRNGQVMGYVTAFKRRHPDAPQYAEPAIMKDVIEKLKSEKGIDVLKLGLSPGANLQDQRYKSNWFTSKLFAAAYRSKTINRYCYNLVGHTRYKRRFRGREEKTYIASDTRFNLPRLLALIGLCGIA